MGRNRKDNIVGMKSLVPDTANANRGTLIGKGLLHKSFSELGAGRSILIDRNDRIIAGNKSHEAAGHSGITEAVVVDAGRDELVVVRRTDLDLDTKEGREMAALDNTTTYRNVAWDESALQYISQKFGVETRDWGVETRDWGAGNTPKLNPVQQDTLTKAGDVERAQERISAKLGRNRLEKATRRVKCPNCGFEFDVQKYD